MAAKVVVGNILDQMKEADHIIVCAYSNLKSATGELVMMSGVAYDLYVKYPTSAKAYGSAIKEACGDCGFYYLICKAKFGIFQVGVVPRNGPSLSVVSESTKQLVKLAEDNPEKKYYLEAMWKEGESFMYDGFLHMLPDNVTVWASK
jgi:hypothetical protein